MTDTHSGEEEQDGQNSLPDIMGECDNCSYKIHRGSVEERVSLLAQEGEPDDVDDVALRDKTEHEMVCEGTVKINREWEDGWGISNAE